MEDQGPWEVGSDLDRVEAQLNGILYRLQHSLQALPPCHADESVRPQRVKAQIQQRQPCNTILCFTKGSTTASDFPK